MRMYVLDIQLQDMLKYINKGRWSPVKEQIKKLIDDIDNPKILKLIYSYIKSLLKASSK